MKRHYVIRMLFWLLVATNSFAQVVKIPDPNLENAIREALQLPTGEPITQKEMQQLITLAAWHKGITDLTGLEHAIYLKRLSLRYNQITDISPLTNLINLEELMLDDNPIADISPLAGLPNLKILRIPETLVTDFTPIEHLNLIEFYYDQVCYMPPVLPPVTERIENRTFPSVNAMFGRIVNRQDLSDEKRLSLHDLMSARQVNQTLLWDTTSTEPTYALAVQLAAVQLAADTHFDISNSQAQLELNPNMIFIRGLEWFSTGSLDAFPSDSDFWLRDNDGNILYSQKGRYPAPQINLAHPQFQDLLVKRIVAIDRCGLDDGVFFDGFSSQATGFVGRDLHPITDKEIIDGWRDIFTKVRSQVRDDFLIIVNANETKLTPYAEFINGSFMEVGKDYPGGYTRPWLMKLEDTLSWNEENLREPTINCLEGEGMSIEPPDGPNNLRWVRLFTTLSLTHSDGYVLYTTGSGDFLGGADHDHLWYDFWDADLGHPVGPKTQRYQDIEGLFIREFTNGWAVYNRSGQAQTISLPRLATAVGNGDLRSSTTHLLPDLDGEIYLRVGKPFDINTDGVVNVLDLIIVSQAFGSPEGDINGDGETNILDLTLVAQQLN